MKLRRNQPATTLRGSYHFAPCERPATASARGRCATRHPLSLPPGLLARLLARKNRLKMFKINALDQSKAVSSPDYRRISRLKFRP